MKLKPTSDRILVRRHKIKMTSKGGIMLPDINKFERTRSFEATVLAVGDGRRYNGKLIPVDVAEGDIIVYGKFNGVDIPSEDRDLVLLHEHDILAKVI